MQRNSNSNNETTPLFTTRLEKEEENINKNYNKHHKQRRRNSDGSLDFERIVNGYSIQGKVKVKYNLLCILYL